LSHFLFGPTQQHMLVNVQGLFTCTEIPTLSAVPVSNILKRVTMFREFVFVMYYVRNIYMNVCMIVCM
jgi:hypothetical protein